MDVIKFKYAITDDNLKAFISDNTTGFNGSFLYGYMEPYQTSVLDSCKMFAVVQMDDNDDQTKFSYINPIAIIAKREIEACELYNKINNSSTASVLCVLNDKPKNAKVEAV